jgi:hypothetical protein
MKPKTISSKSAIKLGAVAMPVISSTQESEIRTIVI